MDLFHNLYLSAAQTAERETQVGSHELFALMVKAPNFSKQIRSYIPPAKPGSLKHTVGTPQVLKSCLQETLDFTRSAKWCLFLPCIWKNYIRLSLGETTTTTTLYKGCYLTYLSSQLLRGHFWMSFVFHVVLFLWSVHFHDTTTGDHQMLQLWQMTSVVAG